MLHFALVEDDVEQAALIDRFCQDYAKTRGESIRTEAFREPDRFLEAYRDGIDAVFMDIAMPGMNGIECARRLRQIDQDVPLVFVTQMAQYALKGYEVGALDFLVKPLDHDEFCLKLDRLQRVFRHRRPVSVQIPQKGGNRFLNVQDITYIEVFDHSLIFHTPEGQVETYGKLSSLEEDERFAGFIRTGKSHLVNGACISFVGQESLTVCGTQVPLSRRKRKECLEKLAVLRGRGLA